MQSPSPQIQAIQFPLVLAPMVGMSHVALRLLVRDYMPSQVETIWPTEMLNSRKIPRETLGETFETKKGPQETGIVPQILGNEEEPIRLSIEKLKNWGAIGIDINMGCPVQKALKHNYGVALMGDPDYAAQVVSMAVKASNLPVSVKLRAGNQNDFSYLKNFCQGLVEAGASWITLHPRTAGQKRRGLADWEQIKKLKSELSVPVIGNGDIQTWQDVIEMKSQTGCDLVMSGRALAARPWMMWQLAEDLGFEIPQGGVFSSRTGDRREAPRTALEEGAEYGRSLLRFLDYCEEYFPESYGIRKFRFHVKMTCVWLQFGHALFALTARAETYQRQREFLLEFFSVPQEMNPRTDLRE
ncbi:MAG: tRNA-dihydrouridine synthase family protein [Proteobacteria bacterium]|nr:tRNA-dihydrouridine synthase family protein [Pseudomonadota bacterium]